MKNLVYVLILFVLIFLYFCFFQFKEIGVVKLTGYIVKEEDLAKTLTDSESKKTIELTEVNENDIIFKQGNRYFIGDDHKNQINLDYPII